MKIVLRAILPSSGRAIVKEDGCLYHIQPPYNLPESKTKANIINLDYSILQYGFEEETKSFDNHDQLARYLLDRYKDYHSENPQEEIAHFAILNDLNIIFFNFFVEELQKDFKRKNFEKVIAFGKELIIRNQIFQATDSYELVQKLLKNSKKGIKDRYENDTYLDSIKKFINEIESEDREFDDEVFTSNSELFEFFNEEMLEKHKWTQGTKWRTYIIPLAKYHSQHSIIWIEKGVMKEYIVESDDY